MIALGVIGGALIGMMTGQGSAGVIGGFVVGVILAIIIFAIDRR